MGKAKKARSTSHKKTKPPSTNGAAHSAEFAHLPREQAEMFQGLTHVQGSIREATCVALATMFGDVRSRDDERTARDKLQRMVDSGLLQKLVPLLGDPLKMVRLHALGALRNLSVTGGIDTCELLTISASVMTPLVRVITEHATLERLEKNDLHAVLVLEQAIALLANLCESCAAAVHELTRGNLLDPIMVLARHARAHAALHLETLKLLLLITDGNATLNAIFSRTAAYHVVLGELIDGGDDAPMATRLHAVGIAMHVHAIMESDANVAKLLPVVEAALAYDAVHVVQAAQLAAESWTLAHATPYDDEQSELDPITDEDKAKQTQAQTHVRAWKESVQTLTLALELVAELAAPSDDDDDDAMDEDEWASDDEEAMEQYAAAQMEASTVAAAASGEASSSSPVAKALAASRVLPLCVAILQGVVAVPTMDNSTITTDFAKIRARVAHAVTNLVQSLPWMLLHNDALPQLFRNFCTLYRNIVAESAASKQLSFDAAASSTDDLEAATTAAMWAVLRRCSLEKQQLPIAGDDANLLLGGALQSTSVETRLNAVGMVGCVGQQTTDATENAVVGRCLLAGLQDANLEVVTEALNALFDVFGGEDFDANFTQLGLLAALEASVPAIKSKLRAEQKAMDRDLVAHVKETQLNLTRFIKYKKKHL